MSVSDYSRHLALYELIGYFLCDGTGRTDLPKVVQSTGGVKRIGFSRRVAIPSLHKNIKAPPKRLPPPPKKPTRKKEESDDDSDDLDENGKKKIRPGDPEWYMMDVD